MFKFPWGNKRLLDMILERDPWHLFPLRITTPTKHCLQMSREEVRKPRSSCAKSPSAGVHPWIVNTWGPLAQSRGRRRWQSATLWTVCASLLACAGILGTRLASLTSLQGCWSQLSDSVFSRACAKPLESCTTFCDPLDCSLPGSSVHWIL